MKFAVSNIAWAPEDAGDAYRLLAEHDIGGLEIAPGLFFAGADDPLMPDTRTIEAAMAPLRDTGLALVSMQSLLFGVSGAALFGTEDERATIEAGMRRAIDLAGRLGIPNLVFGSPRQRVIPDAMDQQTAIDIAAQMFRRLGSAAGQAGCQVAIETNPAGYGTNFLTRTRETLSFVGAVDHPAITLNLDIGALLMNAETDQLQTIAGLANEAGHLSHVHISEPQLAPAPADAATLRDMLQVISSVGYDRWYSIEMRSSSILALDDLKTSLIRLDLARTGV